MGSRNIEKLKNLNYMEKCICENPILESETRKCGRCNLYIDRSRHIELSNPTDDNWEDPITKKGNKL